MGFLNLNIRTVSWDLTVAYFSNSLEKEEVLIEAKKVYLDTNQSNISFIGIIR